MEKQVIQSVGFRNIYKDGKAIGFQFKVRLPYYRGVFLSQIKAGDLIIDGERIPADKILWRVNGEDFTKEEMFHDWKRHWMTTEPATIIVPKEGGLAQGYHDLDFGFCCTHSYMPPFMEDMSDPNKPEFIHMPEFGHNRHTRRMLIV